MRLCCPALLALGLALAGCASPPARPKYALSGDALADAEHFIQFGPARDKVLWQYRAGLAALRRGRHDLAKRYFDDALARLQNIYGPDKSARQARSYFRSEARKTFLGEPYERVMAYYYRGILYWMDGEPDNARACFRSAQLMDSDAENQSYAADYVLLDYLDGYITARLGGDGADALRRADANARAWKPPAFSLKANVLVFVDYGPGPAKFATGQYAEQLRFRCPASKVRSARVKVADATGKAVPYDDLCFQATTRGGRVMDHVLANKAVFKSATDAVGDVALISGAVMAGTQRGHAQTAGLAMLGAGLVSKILSASTVPQADTRTWDNLPMFLSFVALELSPGPHTLTIEFLDQAGQPLAELTKTVSLIAPADGPEQVLYVSDQSIIPKTP